MGTLSPVSLVPTSLFALLGLYFLLQAIRRNTRRTCGWGRGGGEVPLSRVSYGIFSVIFFDIALMLAYDGPPPRTITIVLLVGFVAMIAAGTRDTIIYRRKQDPSGKRKR